VKIRQEKEKNGREGETREALCFWVLHRIHAHRLCTFCAPI